MCVGGGGAAGGGARGAGSRWIRVTFLAFILMSKMQGLGWCVCVGGGGAGPRGAGSRWVIVTFLAFMTTHPEIYWLHTHT